MSQQEQDFTLKLAAACMFCFFLALCTDAQLCFLQQHQDSYQSSTLLAYLYVAFLIDDANCNLNRCNAQHAARAHVTEPCGFTTPGARGYLKGLEAT